MDVKLRARRVSFHVDILVVTCNRYNPKEFHTEGIEKQAVNPAGLVKLL